MLHLAKELRLHLAEAKWLLLVIFFGIMGFVSFLPDILAQVDDVEHGLNYDRELITVNEDGSAVYSWVSTNPKILNGFDVDGNPVYVSKRMFETAKTFNYESLVFSMSIDKTTCDVSLYDGGVMIGSPDLVLSHSVRESVFGSGVWFDSVLFDGCTISDSQNQIIVEKDSAKVIYDLSPVGFEWTYEFTNDNPLKNNHQYGFVFSCEGIDCVAQIDQRPLSDGETLNKRDFVSNDIRFGSDISFDTKNFIHDFTRSITQVSPTHAIVDFTDSKKRLNFGEKLTVDPTFTYTVSTDEISTHAIGATGTSCGDAYSIYDNEAQAEMFLRDSSSGTNFSCHRGSNTWDVSSIPDTATITDVTIRYDVDAASNPRNCDIMEITTDPRTYQVDNAAVDNSDADLLWDDMNTSTTYVSNSSDCATVSTNYVQDLGTDADADLQALLSSDWFAVGWKTTNELRDGSSRSQNIDDVELQVTYSVASLPDGVDDLSSNALGKTFANLFWSAPDLHGESLINYLLNYTSPHGDPQTFLANSTSLSFNMTGLSPNTQYSVRASALTVNGYNATGNIYNFTTPQFDPPFAPTLGADALSETAIRFQSVAGAPGSNSTIWYGLQCELNNSGGWMATVPNATLPASRLYEYTGLTFGDVLICQWRDGSVDGWSNWSNNATDTLSLSVLSAQRTNSPDDKLMAFIDFIDGQGGVYFGLGALPFAVMLIGFMAGKKTVRIFTLATLFMMGMIHASGYYVYPSWYWTLSLLFGIGLVMGRMKSD